MSNHVAANNTCWNSMTTTLGTDAGNDETTL